MQHSEADGRGCNHLLVHCPIAYRLWCMVWSMILNVTGDTRDCRRGASRIQIKRKRRKMRASEELLLHSLANMSRKNTRAFEGIENLFVQIIGKNNSYNFGAISDIVLVLMPFVDNHVSLLDSLCFVYTLYVGFPHLINKIITSSTK